MKLNDEFINNAKSYLKFMRADRTALLFLSAVILLLVIVNIIVKNVNWQQALPSDMEKLEKAIAEAEKSNVDKNTKKLFSFNPNLITEEKLDSLQLPAFVKRNLINYRKAGGKIKSETDFRKIYGMNDTLFTLVEPFLIVEQPIDKSKSEYKQNKPNSKNKSIVYQHRKEKTPVVRPKSRKVASVELNAATAEDLKKVKGIGDVFSKRIIKYRNLLGGYHKKEQLLEVYGINDSIFIAIQPQIIVDKANIKPLRLNFADYKTLLRHPYLDKKDVSAILTYKNQRGAYCDKSLLIKDSVISAKTYNKVKCYLTVD